VLVYLQHKDDNSLVKDNFWKEIAGELHAQDKELPRTQHCRRMAGSRQGSGMVCVNRSLKRQGNGMVCVNPPLVSFLHCTSVYSPKSSRRFVQR
jgi:hypothetical protein